MYRLAAKAKDANGTSEVYKAKVTWRLVGSDFGHADQEARSRSFKVSL